MAPTPSLFKIGTRVRCERSKPSSGSWPRFAGRTATVVALNRIAGEIGVNFGGGHNAEAWFLRTELVPLGTGESRQKAPKSRATAAVA